MSRHQDYLRNRLNNSYSRSFKKWIPLLLSIFLLSFVQEAFPYQVDHDQFGHEKYMLPDELIFYGNSDCDDRVIFFHYLVNNLLKLEVIGLETKNHLFSAVEAPAWTSVPVFHYQQKAYFICDPTIQNSPPGFSAVQEDPNILDFNRFFQKSHQTEKNKGKISEMGGFASEHSTNITDAGNGEKLVTGTINNHSPYKFNIPNDSVKRSFLLRFDKDLNPFHIKVIQGTGDVTTHSLSQTSAGNILLLGSFKNSVTLDGYTVQSENGGYFCACLDKNEKTQWLKKIILPEREADKGFLVKMDSTGKVLAYELQEIIGFDNTYSIYSDESENHYIRINAFYRVKSNNRRVKYTREAAILTLFRSWSMKIHNWLKENTTVLFPFTIHS
ncbi:MAG: hypothetical protein HC906_15180 [Bacteroidales bacterium]|nr:hypothetical protein [Bacteroidales bacterium]